MPLTGHALKVMTVLLAMSLNPIDDRPSQIKDCRPHPPAIPIWLAHQHAEDVSDLIVDDECYPAGDAIYLSTVNMSFTADVSILQALKAHAVLSGALGQAFVHRHRVPPTQLQTLHALQTLCIYIRGAYSCRPSPQLQASQTSQTSQTMENVAS